MDDLLRELLRLVRVVFRNLDTVLVLLFVAGGILSPILKGIAASRARAKEMEAKRRAAGGEPEPQPAAWESELARDPDEATRRGAFDERELESEDSEEIPASVPEGAIPEVEFVPLQPEPPRAQVDRGFAEELARGLAARVAALAGPAEAGATSRREGFARFRGLGVASPVPPAEASENAQPALGARLGGGATDWARAMVLLEVLGPPIAMRRDLPADRF